MIDVGYQHPARRFPRKETLRAVESVLRNEHGPRWHVSVVFTNDRFMRRINKTFLDHNGITDVIAFPLQDDLSVDAEVYVNLDQAARQARQERVTLTEEIRRLLIHGILHLLGYRDSTKARRLQMRKLEDRYLGILRKKQ